MGLKCQQIIQAIEKYAPKYLAEDWDNVGLQIGHPAQEVAKVIVTLDVDMHVINQAVEQNVDMIVAHHPLLFKPLKSLRFDQPMGAMIAQLIRNKICLYIAHTNLDNAEAGVNAILAQVLGLDKVEILAPTHVEKLFKLVVFIPETHVDPVMQAVSDAGAGFIGNYSHCTFQTEGIGTFKPLDGAKPFLGEVGQIEKTPEVRLETILSERILAKVLKAMLKAHPYEEVAYDIIPLHNAGKASGLGCIGYLDEAVTLENFIGEVKKVLKLEGVQFGGELQQEVKKIALCGGSGASLINNAVFKGADVYVTGDIKYHEGQDCLRKGMAFVNPGHYATEAIIVPVLAKYLNEELNANKKAVDILVSKINTNPFSYL
jgi:dinuclear metal center YbgI/SA1388 family protein